MSETLKVKQINKKKKAKVDVNINTYVENKFLREFRVDKVMTHLKSFVIIFF